jgi:H+/Cl- antiporter ClcA
VKGLCTDAKERVFVVGGISAGIACAFRAPIGGVMFALEEVRSSPGSPVWFVVVWCGLVWFGVVWCGLVWFGAVWCGSYCCSIPFATFNIHHLNSPTSTAFI